MFFLLKLTKQIKTRTVLFIYTYLKLSISSLVLNDLKLNKQQVISLFISQTKSKQFFKLYNKNQTRENKKFSLIVDLNYFQEQQKNSIH